MFGHWEHFQLISCIKAPSNFPIFIILDKYFKKNIQNVLFLQLCQNSMY